MLCSHKDGYLVQKTPETVTMVALTLAPWATLQKIEVILSVAATPKEPRKAMIRKQRLDTNRRKAFARKKLKSK